jgi:acetyl/propionyl-CoA carboxylase alpha subunit
MRRALGEYEVRGIRTTVPFFSWLFRQPSFGAAAFHTEYLDGLLQQQEGRPFLPPDVSLEQVAVIGAALALRASGGMEALAGRLASPPDPDSPRVPAAWGLDTAWRRRARFDALRG